MSVARLSSRLPDRANDLVVLSHLAWNWVWQRPQHLISRIARGRRTWFVEEPVVRAEAAEPRLMVRDAGAVRRVWLELPPDAGNPHRFDVAGYGPLLLDLLAEQIGECDVWLYSPMALQIAAALRPRLLVYDVMDDLAAFRDGSTEMARNQRRALLRADVVFAGGRSLYRTALAVRSEAGTHLFPSGVETAHYATSRALRGPHPRPVAGYVGVLDERLDGPLLEQLTGELPDWDVVLAGPVAQKIDPATLPTAPNLHYLGMQPYERLPEVMAGFDVALMPFALNEATRSISPTKTLEYLAAGLPVVSTRVPDVVADWSEVVHFADTGTEFAAACRKVAADPVAERDAAVAPLRRRHEWDAIAEAMRRIMTSAGRSDVDASADIA
jgi:glycosyltransferase involved in cell wall biosynthesis